MRTAKQSRRTILLPRGLILLAACCVAACPLGDAPAEEAAGPARPAGWTTVFDSRTGLGPGWEDLGWAPHTLAQGYPAALDLAGRGGWIISHPGLTGSFGSLTFRVRAPPTFGDFLEVGLDSAAAATFPRVKLTVKRGQPQNGYTVFRLSLRELNPKGLPFDRIFFRAHAEVSSDRVLFDDVALIEGDVPSDSPSAPTRTVRLTVDCAAPSKPISPLIYGHAGSAKGWWELNATTHRWGGNPTTRYNWENGHAWNTASDWFYRNVNLGSGEPLHFVWLEENLRRGVTSAITMPTIGWVAKDSSSYSFPVSIFGPQQQVAPENGDIGNGVSPDGKPLPPLDPGRTSVRAPPEFIGRWVQAIRARDQARGKRSVHEYILDNEPALWNTTHRDVHPKPVSYDELLERTLTYATAIRQADPEAVIAGPAAWGWPELFESAVDSKNGAVKLDRIAHGNTPLLPWLLRKVREHEKETGLHLLDVVDVHFYPQGQNVGLGEKGGVDPDTAARRIRSTRSLWDPTYLDESWINENMRLIPRLQEWIAENAPGLGLSFGEYNFGAEGHMSGGLAVAEALGRFGQLGLTSAYYWTEPPAGTPSNWAFRAYRNYDGKNAHFLERSSPARSSDPLASVFASRDAAGERLVAVILNLDPNRAADAEVDLAGCGPLSNSRLFSYAGERGGLQAGKPIAAAADGKLRRRLPAYSMTVIELQRPPKKR